MNSDYSSEERNPKEFTMFALAFIGFMMGTGGIVLGSKTLAVFGGLAMLMAVYSFRSRRSRELE
jgi:hypothetical protein